MERAMKKIIITFGLISGAISALMMGITVPFAHKIAYNRALLIGYTTIVLSLLLVYFGVRSYRDNVNSGQITFGKAFAVGLCITLISCLCYVVAWEVIYFNFMPNFMDEYSTHALERAKAAGASDAALQKQAEELKKGKEMYNNVFYNAALTFIEPFPVGLVITLLSAVILRRKTGLQTAQTPLPAS
jgi:hypothetical protein